MDDEHIKCPKCDYDLYGLRELRCPECGFHFTVSAVKAMMSAAEGQRLASAQTVISFSAIVTAIGACIVAPRVGLPFVLLLLLGVAGYTWAFVTWVKVTDRYYGPEALPWLVKLYMFVGMAGGIVLNNSPKLMLWAITVLCIAAWIVFAYSWPKLPERDSPRHQGLNQHARRYSHHATGLIILATGVTCLAWALSSWV